MAKFDLRAGVSIDVLTRDELHHELGAWQDRYWAERGRAEKLIRKAVQANAAISTTAAFTIPDSPGSGYIWNIRFAGGLLSAAGVIRMFIGFDTQTGIANPNLIPLGQGNNGIGSVQNWGSGQVWLRNGEYLVFSATGAVTLTSYIVWAIETPEELAWKSM